DHARAATDDGGAVRLRQRLQLDLKLLGDSPQPVVVDHGGPIAPQRDNDDRHVVDLDGLDHPGGDVRRHEIGVRIDLVVDLDEALLPVLANVEPHGDDGAAWQRYRIDVLDPIDLVQELFER